MVLEVFITPGCERCPHARVLARQVAEESGLSYAETDFLAHPERFLELGVEMTPTFVVDGQVIFRGLPTKTVLSQLVRSRLQ